MFCPSFYSSYCMVYCRCFFWMQSRASENCRTDILWWDFYGIVLTMPALWALCAYSFACTIQKQGWRTVLAFLYALNGIHIAYSHIFFRSLCSKRIQSFIKQSTPKKWVREINVPQVWHNISNVRCFKGHSVTDLGKLQVGKSMGKINGSCILWSLC